MFSILSNQMFWYNSIVKLILAMVAVLSACISANAAEAALHSCPPPDTEYETNLVADVWDDFDRIMGIRLEFNASPSNNVQAAFGVDEDHDGVLSIEESEFTVGWDCGAWFWRDRRANRVCRADGTGPRLDLTLHLRRGRVTRLSSSAAFPTTELPTCFDPDWNLARVVSRGASDVRVTSKISPNALLLSIK